MRLQLLHVGDELVHVLAAHAFYQRLFVVRVGVNALRRRHNEQRLALDEAGNLACRFVIVDALYRTPSFGKYPAYLVLAVLLVTHGVVVIDDGDGILSRTAAEHLVKMRTLLLVVEMLVLDEYLPYAETAVYELPVSLHQDGLPLCGIVRLVFFVRAVQFPARALDVVQPPYLGRARRDPYISWTQLARKSGYDVVVHILIIAVDERHRAYFADEFDIEISHIVLSSVIGH